METWGDINRHIPYPPGNYGNISTYLTSPLKVAGMTIFLFHRLNMLVGEASRRGVVQKSRSEPPKSSGALTEISRFVAHGS